MTETNIYYEETLVGRVLFDDTAGIGIAYDRRWLEHAERFPLSLTMPLSTKVYGNDVAAPWLANLLPEAQQLRTLSRTLGLSPADPLAILIEIGGDTAGAISIGQPCIRNKWDLEPLKFRYNASTDSEALARHIDELEPKPFLAGEDGVRTSLAGGQTKTALAVIDPDGEICLRLPSPNDHLAVPKSGAPSTVIFKPDNPRLPGIVENEAYCLTLASRIGIPAAKSGIVRARERKALAVVRYDRKAGNDGSLRRIHQEDIAQANGLYPDQKYEQGTAPGLSMRNLLATGRHLPAVEALKLIDQAIFNILVANTDAHAKNYSIILSGEPRLAPLYDVSTVLPWRHLRVIQDHAQRLAGRKRRPKDMFRRHWDLIADESGLNRRGLRVRVQELVDAMVVERVKTSEIVAGQDGAAARVVEDVAIKVEENALRIAKQLNE